MKTDKNISDFYDAISAYYNEMIDFEKRFEKEIPVFKNIKEKYDLKTVLDAGAGTGFHSLLLAKLGLNVTAVDVSGKMLEKLKENAQHFDLSVKTEAVNFQQLYNTLDTSYDGVLCLGNSMAHILEDQALENVLSGFFSLLKPGGILIIQVLNYDRIMEEQKKIQNIKKRGSTTFVRFYDYSESRLFFNILKIKEEGEQLDHTLNTVELRPLLHDEMMSFLGKVGFSRIKAYGSLNLDDFDQNISANLVLIAQKSQDIG